jgi:hypothetical protein
MMMSVVCLLWISAFVACIVHIIKPQIPIYLAVLLVCMAGLLGCLPLR